MPNFRFLGHLEVPKHFAPATHTQTFSFIYIDTSRVPVLRTGKHDVPLGLPLGMDGKGEMVFIPIPVPEKNYFSSYRFPFPFFPIIGKMNFSRSYSDFPFPDTLYP